MIFKFFILSSLSLVVVNGFFYNVTPYLSLVKSDAKFLDYYSPFFDKSVNLLQTLSDSNELNPECRSSLRRWINGLNDREHWALKFLEATGKTINGKLVGRNVNFGSFDYCIMFYANSKNKIDFDGKYCMISVLTKEVETIKQLENFKNYHKSLSERSRWLNEFSMGNGYGICMPSTCKIEELVSVVNRMIKPYELSIMAPSRCTTKNEPEPWTKLQLASLVILSTFVVLCTLTLLVENEFLSCFSLRDNWNIIYNFEHNAAHDQRWLHGAKVWLLFTSIAVHSMVFYGIYWSPPFATINEIVDGIATHIFLEQTIALGSQMFLIGGFFAFFSWYDVIKLKAIKFNFFLYLFGRYHRILIAGIPILLLYFLLPQAGYGPLFSQITNHLYENCKNNGYKTFISTTNSHDDALDMCIPGNWYLSADSQCYIVNYFLIYYLVVKPKIGLRIAFLQILLSSILTIAYNYYYKLDNFFRIVDFDVHTNLRTAQNLYFPAIFHNNIYTLGIFVAYLAKNKIKPKIIDYKIVRISIWCLLPIMHYYIGFGLPDYFEEAITGNGSFLKNFLKITYPIFYKLSFTSFFFWWGYSVALGYSVQMNKLMSLKIWIPFSRLAFPISISQFLYIAYSFASRREAYTVNRQVYSLEILNNIAFTFVLSNFIFLFVEGPLIKLFKKYSGIRSRSQVLMNADVNNNLGIDKKSE